MRADRWICCQLGAREHFAIARGLLQHGALDRLVTDAWGVFGRFHPELRSAPVVAFTRSLALTELVWRACQLHGWDRVIARNRWFQRKVVAHLAQLYSAVDGKRPIVFAYSYAARDIFRLAKKRGWKTVLGQIDPGPAEENIVTDEALRVPQLCPTWRRAPESYWAHWREECDLSDCIVVNSEWSERCLVNAGVDQSKLATVPLAFEPIPRQTPAFEVKVRSYPSRFTAERPLRVLFLGQINLRKGIARLLSAMEGLRDEPVELLLAGPIQIHVPPAARCHPSIRWLGKVDRHRTHELYKRADVFILPTLSDGFALTQLEAVSCALPIIASRNCGQIVQHGVNGLLLDEPTTEAITSVIKLCVTNPQQLADFSSRAAIAADFTISAVGARMLNLARWMP